ncbi:multidrug transporter subunit MdtN [Bordetella genomosp. 10]|uniref:Multidrug transporter subunit MdtN n=1 Tax=Bordetella genomosp. 10 TaxID=1416804 RepID=A0A261S2S5_9BORD|nr:multidrug transporter subunit MdtN [Bordetella genomosp. 10]OZI30783.1 multidrug transporter subunit MdtN [Bordetella genomosp. 10]
MKQAGIGKSSAKGRAVAAAIIVLGAAAVAYAWHRNASYPSTDDATIDADYVHVAAPVGGRIVRLAVRENQRVAKGDVLFEIDPVPYRLTVAQAQADVEVAQAALETRRKTLIGERAHAAIAREQRQRAEHNYGLADRTARRLAPLAAQGFVPAQQYDQAQVARQDAAASLRQAETQQDAASQTIGDDADAVAALHAREAALARARHALEDTVVRAPHEGYVAGLTVLAGETVAPSQPVFTLIDAGAWFAVANFRETELAGIAPGDCATVYSMIDRRVALPGKVAGIGAGVLDVERVNLPRSLPLVEKSVNWVRVAQRFPVRVQLEAADGRLLRVGASAVVEVRHGPACR